MTMNERRLSLARSRRNKIAGARSHKRQVRGVCFEQAERRCVNSNASRARRKNLVLRASPTTTVSSDQVAAWRRSMSATSPLVPRVCFVLWCCAKTGSAWILHVSLLFEPWCPFVNWVRFFLLNLGVVPLIGCGVLCRFRRSW